MKVPKPVVLIIMDGWGIAPPSNGNAISIAKTPNLSRFTENYPHTKLTCFGPAVGLQKGDMGDSETGHLNIGAGRIVFRDVLRINMSIADGSFMENPTLLKAAENAKTNNSSLHIMGLVGPAHVHSSLDHLFALLDFAKLHDLKNVYLHLFTDGRDSPPKSSSIYLAQIENKLKETGVGQIATVSGRYYAMDRDNRWDRIEKAYDALVLGVGEKAKSASEAIENSYKNDITDEFIIPTVILNDKGEPLGKINDGDSVIFFNFRADRGRELSKAIIRQDFETMVTPATLTKDGQITTFKRNKIVKDIFYVTLTEYEKDLTQNIVFEPRNIENPLAKVLSENKIKQLHIAETEKYAHVTYFLNGGQENPFPGEVVIKIPSPKIATYDLQPEMNASEVTDNIINSINEDKYEFIVVNFANGDMVGHTGNITAGIKACETVDSCIGKITSLFLEKGGVGLITADHGNAEEMTNSDGSKNTEHSLNPVPLIIIGKEFTSDTKIAASGILADIAPTILSLLNIEKPVEMTGRNLLMS